MATELKQVSAWLPEEVLEEVRKLASSDRRTVSMWLRLLVEREVTEKAEVAAWSSG